MSESRNANRLRQLQAFCHAAQTLSMSRAAKRLGVSQPSVSLRIQSLERGLDALLFERSGPKIRLTPAGALLLEMAQPLVDGFARLDDAFAARLGDVDAGPLDVAAGEATLLYLLPDVVRAFSAAHPQVEVRLHNVTGADGMARLRADEVDFAVGSMIDVPDDLVWYPIHEFAPVLIACEGHPLSALPRVTLEDLSPYGLVLPPRHLSTWGTIDAVFEQHGVPYEVALEAGGWEVIKRYVEIGTGISIVTSVCLRGDERLCVRPMHEYFPTRSYGVVARRGKFLSPQAKRFLELMDADFFALDALPPRGRRTPPRRPVAPRTGGARGAGTLITNL